MTGACLVKSALGGRIRRRCCLVGHLPFSLWLRLNLLLLTMTHHSVGFGLGFRWLFELWQIRLNWYLLVLVNLQVVRLQVLSDVQFWALGVVHAVLLLYVGYFDLWFWVTWGLFYKGHFVQGLEDGTVGVGGTHIGTWWTSIFLNPNRSCFVKLLILLNDIPRHW